MTNRRILRLSGADTRSFLQGLITNDIAKVDHGLVYTALLTPQGKYIADFFVCADGADILLDADAGQADALMSRLSMYKLRADVQISSTDLQVHRGLGPLPDRGFTDPRHAALGWRTYSTAAATADDTDWDAIEVANLIPASNIELTPETFILEAGFERLNGVDFRKGCYVGQEVTARMKHKTELRKGLVQVQIDGATTTGDDIIANDKPAGTIFRQSDAQGLAYLRFDRAKGPMTCGTATVTWDGQKS